MGKAELKLMIDEDLLAEAEAVGVNARRVVESALRVALSKAARAAEDDAAPIPPERTPAP